MIQLLPGGLGPGLPFWNLRFTTLDVHLLWSERIAAFFRDQRPVRPSVVVPISKLCQTDSATLRVVIHSPVNLFLLQGLVKPLQKSQLGWGAILYPHMPEQILEVVAESRYSVINDGPLSVTRKGSLGNLPHNHSASARAESSALTTSRAL